MKRTLFFIFCISIFAITGCNIKENLKNLIGGNYMKENITLFPRPLNTWVGDPMPFFSNGKYQMFFLEDFRNNDVGFHPFSLFETNNFYDYTYKGVVIPYVNEPNSQELALGTGSVMKDNKGLYHAFYTGHNGNLSPKEAIMHATSTDMKTWHKIPEDTFYSSIQYEKNDFRDPYVFYSEWDNKYWMLITTRKDNTGVIAKYTSTDLKYWKDEGVFFANDMGTDSNLECPSLVKFKDKYYLAFSDQWPDRLVHYRIYDPVTNTFTKPTIDSFDGSGFYAGRLETDGEKLYVFGWIPTKESHDDKKNYDWAGNLAVHELIQTNNGELKVKMPSTITDSFSSDRLNIVRSSEGIHKNNNSFTFTNSNQNREFIRFEKKSATLFAEGTIIPKGKNPIFGFSFNASDNNPELNIIFNGSTNEVAFYNTIVENIKYINYKSKINFEILENQAINFKLLMENGIVVLYLNDSKVLSTRMYDSYNKDWEIFAVNSQIEVKNIKN